MKAVLDKLELAFAAFGGFIGWFLGGFDGFLYALVVFVVMDYFTGVLAAGVKKELSSEVGFKGIAKKVCIFVLVGIANIVDTQVIHDGAVIRTLAGTERMDALRKSQNRDADGKALFNDLLKNSAYAFEDLTPPPPPYAGGTGSASAAADDAAMRAAMGLPAEKK